MWGDRKALCGRFKQVEITTTEDDAAEHTTSTTTGVVG